MTLKVTYEGLPKRKLDDKIIISLEKGLACKLSCYAYDVKTNKRDLHFEVSRSEE